MTNGHCKPSETENKQAAKKENQPTEDPGHTRRTVERTAKTPDTASRDQESART